MESIVSVNAAGNSTLIQRRKDIASILLSSTVSRDRGAAIFSRRILGRCRKGTRRQNRNLVHELGRNLQLFEFVVALDKTRGPT